MFEERHFALIGTLERIAEPLAAAGIPYELIGGGAVMVQVDRVETISNPPVRPEYLTVNGVQVAVIPAADSLQMKLSNNRHIDRVPVRDLDPVGLITPEIEHGLPSALQVRLPTGGRAGWLRSPNTAQAPISGGVN